MNLLGIFILIIFLGMAVSSFYFWAKGQNILSKYLKLKDAFTFWRIREKIPESEWKLFKKYKSYQFMCFFGGIILIILLFILQWNFHLFIKDPKQH
jgi:hypothetical protein